MTLLSGSSSTEIDESVERCWAVVNDVEHWPAWQPGLERVAVISRDEQARPLICDTVSDAKITTVRCRVEVSYEPSHRLSFARVASDDIDGMEGSWELEALPGDRTRATFRLAVDPGPVGFVARPLERALRPLVVGRRAEELAREVAARG